MGEIDPVTAQKFSNTFSKSYFVLASCEKREGDKPGFKIAAKCVLCESVGVERIVRGDTTSNHNFTLHLQKYHPEDYEVFQQNKSGSKKRFKLDTSTASTSSNGTTPVVKSVVSRASKIKPSIKKGSKISINIEHLPEDDDDTSHHSTINNPVLIDTDGGIYDAWALAIALRSADRGSQSPRSIDIVGITTVNGCTTVDNATRNVAHLVSSLGQNLPPIPIFKGTESPLTRAPGTATKRPSFFGVDGYGDIPNLPATPEARIQSDHAITGIIKMAEKYKGKLAIVCLGPLTNLAMAVKQKPEIRHYIKEIFIVGGNSDGMGNMTVASEFNFFVDPEAANIVLESFNLCPVFVLPWETCLKSAALSQSFRTNTIANLDTSEVELLNKLEQSFLEKQDDQWIVPDAVLMGCFLNREMMRKTEHYHCTVEVRGKHTRGMMVVDKNFIGQHPANVTLITEVSRKLFGKMIIWAVGEMESDDGEDNQSHVGQDSIKIEPGYF